MEPKKYRKADKDAVAQKAYQVYERTLNCESPYVVIGPNGIRDNPELAANFGLIAEDSNDGAIFAWNKWTLLDNDAFILGAMNAQKVVYLATDRLPVEKDLWSVEEHRPTTLGREMAFFLLAGYTPFIKSFSIGFAPPCAGRSLTLSQLWKKIAQTEVPDFVLSSFKSS